MHINVKEMLAIFNNLASFKEILKNRTVQLYTDNQTIYYVLLKVTSNKPNLLSILKKIVALCQ